MQVQSLDAFKAQCREPERIWPMWRTRGQHTLATRGGARWQHLGSPALVVMKPEEHPDALPSGQILDGVFQVHAAAQFDDPRGIGGGCGLPRCLDLAG